MTRLKRLSALAATAMLLGAGTAQATQYLNENFDYPAGNLYGQGGWVKIGKFAEAPIQVGATPLVYPGYQSAAAGSAVTLAGNNNAQDEKLWIAPLGDNVTEGTFYASMLVKVTEATADMNYFFNFVYANSSGFGDGKSGGYYGHILVTAGDTPGKYKLGIAKSQTTMQATYAQELNLGETYLMVLKYEIVSGNSNDVLSFWLNPATGLQSEPAADLTSTSGTDLNKMCGLSLYQNGSAVRTSPTVVVDALRMADTWADLFTDNGGGTVTPPPAGDASISINPTSDTMREIYSYVGYKYTFPVVVKGENLTSDITVTLPADFTADATTVPAAAAMSAAGFTVNVTNCPSAAHEGKTSAIRFSTDGADDVVLNVVTSAEPVTEIRNAGQIGNFTAGDYTLYRYTQKAVVTHVDAQNNKVYAQDVFGGIAFDTQYLDGVTIKAGDELTNVFGYLEKNFGLTYFTMVSYETSAEGKTKQPAEMTYAEFMQDPAYYINRLVQVTDVTLSDAPAAWAYKVYNIASGDVKGTMRPFAGTDLIGADQPAGKFTLTGVVTNAAGLISPRSQADVEATASLSMTAEQLFTGEAVAMGQSVVVGRYTVVTEGLAKPAEVYLTGAQRAMYSIDVEQIPAGTGTTVINVTFTPTAIGKHTGRINIDATPTELTTGANFTFAAYDPDNLPAISCDASAVAPFTAAAGEQMQQTITVSTANLIDYGTAKMTMGSGAFILNSTTLLKNGDTQLRVTFAPKAEGTFTDRIELSAMMAEPIYVDLTGSTSGGPLPEATEGDALTFDTSAPLTLLNETFAGQAHNKPLKLTGWVNNAATGTRAWWGYTFADGDDAGNTAAKVTAYDSKVASQHGTPAQMLLITPALDYANAESRMLTFRIMGDNLIDGMEDTLEVLYIEKDDNGEMYAEPLQGMDIPATSDMNKEWVEYVVDLDGQNIADTFFIGFRFTSTRGSDNSAIYYVDDVTYGRTDVPVIKAGTSLVEIEVAAGVTHTTTLAIEGRNLTEAIALSLGGSNPSNFSLSTSTLPALGGNVDLSFASDNIGVHEAYIKLESKGAPTGYIALAANVGRSTGITMIPADADGNFVAYNLAGMHVLTTGHPADLAKLPAGVYIVNGQKYFVR